MARAPCTPVRAAAKRAGSRQTRGTEPMQLYDQLVQGYQQIAQFVAGHPIVLAALALFALLAAIGAWYVLSHHLKVLLLTLLCAAGFAAGLVVLYRGVTSELTDLVVVGGFLTLIFPLLYREALRIAKIAYPKAPAVAAGHAKRAGG